MEILDNESENALLILNDKNEGDVCYVCAGEIRPKVLENLESNKYMKILSETFPSDYIVELTKKGENYFENKKMYLKEIKRKKIFDFLKFLIPVIISLAALIVSIIAIRGV